MAWADDWRLTGQERYLTGAVLEWADWLPPRPGWDHDHCAFCGDKFAGPDLPDARQVGYATTDRYHWVCPPCFIGFRGRFGWQVVGSAPAAEPGAAADPAS
jgi:hypothetical protein